jgi:uncharacterized protein
MKLSWLIPQEKKFFDLLEEYADLTRQCTNQLLNFFEEFDKRKEKWRDIKALEERGDDLLHRIVDELNLTFITPIDREDIYALANGLDDILDFAEGAAERAIMFKIKEPTNRLIELCEVLYQATKELSSAMILLRHNDRWKDLKKHIVEINRLENRGDELMRITLTELFDTKDAIEILKLKEIYEHIEESIDRCEDVANVIESLIVKSG